LSELGEQAQKQLILELNKVSESISKPIMCYEGNAINILKKNTKSLDAQFPAVNLSEVLSQEDMNNLQDGKDWTKRKLVLEKIISEIQLSNNRINPDGVRDIIEPVNRIVLNEKNKSVKKISIETIQAIGGALDREKGKKF